MERKIKKILIVLISAFVFTGATFASDVSDETKYKTGKTLFDKKNYIGAISLLKPVADNGHTEAQYLLGLCYWNSKGNRYEGVKYFWKSAENGHAKAIEGLKKSIENMESKVSTSKVSKTKAAVNTPATNNDKYASIPRYTHAEFYAESRKAPLKFQDETIIMDSKVLSIDSFSKFQLNTRSPNFYVYCTMDNSNNVKLKKYGIGSNITVVAKITKFAGSTMVYVDVLDIIEK